MEIKDMIILGKYGPKEDIIKGNHIIQINYIIEQAHITLIINNWNKWNNFCAEAQF